MERREVMQPLLWFPRYRYIPPGPPGDPGLRDAWELGRRTAAGESRAPTPSPGAVGTAEARAYLSGVWAGSTSKQLVAPLAWPAEACFLAIETAQMAHVERLPGLKKVVIGLSTGTVVGQARTLAERRRVRQLGLSADTTPRPRLDWTVTLPILVWRIYVRLRGWRTVGLSWPRHLAQSIIRAVDRRRAWRAALRVGHLRD
jgi:hypothetical protein